MGWLVLLCTGMLWVVGRLFFEGGVYASSFILFWDVARCFFVGVVGYVLVAQIPNAFYVFEVGLGRFVWVYIGIVALLEY